MSEPKQQLQQNSIMPGGIVYLTPLATLVEDVEKAAADLGKKIDRLKNEVAGATR